MDAKTKEAKLIRLELLKLHRQLTVAVSGLLSRLDTIDPPIGKKDSKPKTREEAKAFFEAHLRGKTSGS